jgi:hypothetical protein
MQNPAVVNVKRLDYRAISRRGIIFMTSYGGASHPTRVTNLLKGAVIWYPFALGGMAVPTIFLN